MHPVFGRTCVAAVAVLMGLPGVVMAAQADRGKPAGLAGVGYTLKSSPITESAFAKPMTALDYAAQLRPPLSEILVSSPFGLRINPVARRRMFHEGVDYAASIGTPIHAAQDGTVREMQRKGRFGFYVRLSHGHGLETAYGHLLKFMPGLHRGSVLRRGDIIGFVGATGAATGNHLHFEVLANGTPVDPQRLSNGFSTRIASLK